MSKPWDGDRGAYVSRMFGAIADRYDLMNRIMTFGMDLRWRRLAAETAMVGPGSRVLDVATGTGDLAFEIAGRVGPTGQVIGIDFAEPMLDRARRKGTSFPTVRFESGDALHIRYPDDTFDAVTCAFGVRNMDDRLGALREMTRAVRPRGRVVILEMTPPQNEVARLYMEDVVPRLGDLIAHAREAYTYLPQSVEEFPPPADFGRLMQEAGLRDVTYRLLNFGTVALHWGVKA